MVSIVFSADKYVTRGSLFLLLYYRKIIVLKEVCKNVCKVKQNLRFMELEIQVSSTLNM